MPKMKMSFDDGAPGEGKDVEQTQQLKPRTKGEPFINDTNEEKRQTTKHPGLGGLGVKGFASSK